MWSFGRLHQVEAGSRTQGFYVLGSCSLVAVFLKELASPAVKKKKRSLGVHVKHLIGNNDDKHNLNS